MRIPDALVGTTVGPLVQEIDARWLMAYAAALGDVHAEYLDTTRPGGRDRPSALSRLLRVAARARLRASALPEGIAVRSVHATHRPPPPPAGARRRSAEHDRHRDRVGAARARGLRRHPPRDGRRRRPPGQHHRLRLPLPRRGVRAAALPPRVAERADSRAMSEPVRSRTAQRDGSPPRRDWSVEVPDPRRASPTPTPSARASGTPSTPTARWPGPPACPTSSCTAPPRWPWRCRQRCGSSRAAPPRRCRPGRLPLRRMVPLPSRITVRGRGLAGEGRLAFQVLGVRRPPRPRARTARHGGPRRREELAP